MFFNLHILSVNDLIFLRYLINLRIFFYFRTTSGCNGIFSRRPDFSTFNMLSKTRLNSYQIKVNNIFAILFVYPGKIRSCHRAYIVSHSNCYSWICVFFMISKPWQKRNHCSVHFCTHTLNKWFYDICKTFSSGGWNISKNDMWLCCPTYLSASIDRIKFWLIHDDL